MKVCLRGACLALCSTAAIFLELNMKLHIHDIAGQSPAALAALCSVTYISLCVLCSVCFCTISKILTVEKKEKISTKPRKFEMASTLICFVMSKTTINCSLQNHKQIAPIIYVLHCIYYYITIYSRDNVCSFECTDIS